MSGVHVRSAHLATVRGQWAQCGVLWAQRSELPRPLEAAMAIAVPSLTALVPTVR